jgi:hypothetical protein
MIKQDLLEYCCFYNGESAVPPKFDQKNEGELWVAEKFVCESIPHLIEEDNARESVASFVAAYVGKWNPYGFSSVMETYFKYNPGVRDYIMKVYN